MRIVMLTEFYPPIIGGLEQHVRNLSAGLVARGHEVAVITLWHEGLPEFEVDRDVRIYRVRGSMRRVDWIFSDSKRQYSPPFPDPETLWGIRRVLSEEQPDVVHAHNWLIHSFLPLKRWSKARLVVTLHDFSLVCAKKTFLHRGSACSGPNLGKCIGCAREHYGAATGVPTALSIWALKHAQKAAVDMFVPVSQAVAAGNGLLSGELPYQIIPNFVPDEVSVLQDEHQYEPYLAQLPEDGYLLFVGALGRHKGIEVLLKAYAALNDAPPLVLIGATWPDTPKTFPPNVIVLKSWPHGAVMHAWQRSMMALVPSICAESCPTVAMEAMATARPVIGSRIGGLPDLVADGETGLLVEPGNPDALREAISRLLADPELRERMGQAGKKRVKTFHSSTVIPQIEQVYRNLYALPIPVTSHNVMTHF